MSAAALAFFPPAPLALAPPSAARWMTKEQICSATGITPRTIERYAKERGTISRELPARGRNGRNVREYLVTSLPSEIRIKLEPQTPVLIPADTGRQVGPSQDAPPSEAPGSLTGPQRLLLSPEGERQARQRLGMIQPLLDYAEPAQRARFAALTLRDGRAVSNSNLLAEYIAETQTLEGKRIGTSTLWNWLRRFRTGGLPALARKAREDKGSSRFFTQYPAAAALVKASYWTSSSTVDRAYRAILRDQALLQIPDEDLPSYATVQRFCERLPKSTTILAREGQRRWNETCAPHLTRAYTDVEAGSIYTADHMIHDVEVRNDCFAGVPADAPMRLRFTCVMDLRSRKIVGYCWTADGDSRSIATALRRAVERFGVPVVFYCDNGADFKKVAKGAKHSYAPAESVRREAEDLIRCGALQQLGINVQYCVAYRPQGKNIERAFRTVHTGLDAIFAGYLTGNSYNRPDAAILAGTEHRMLMKQGRAAESKLVPASLFIKLAQTWLEQDYNAQHKHTGQGMNRQTADQVFEQGYPVAQRRMPDPLVLEGLLFERRKALVRRTAVTLNNRRYVPADPHSYGQLDQANLRNVIVAFDPLDADRAVAYTEDGERLAEMQAERLAPHPLQPTEDSRTQIAAMSQMRGRLLKANAITIQTMHQGVALAGHRTPLQELAGRAFAGLEITELVSQKVPARPVAVPPGSKTLHSEDIAARFAARRASQMQDQAQQSK